MDWFNKQLLAQGLSTLGPKQKPVCG